MSTIPDDHSRDYGNSSPALAALRAEYPAWTIVYEPHLGVYSATLRQPDGSLRYLAGHTVSELLARLQTATALPS
jgi:hypothetical protein